MKLKSGKFAFIIFYFCLFTFALNAQLPTQEWVRRFSGSGFASGLSVKLDSSGYVYVLMKLYTDTTFNDFGLLKYSNIGSLLWNRYYNSPGNLSDDPVAFAVTKAGDVYITGSSGINFTQHTTTVKFNSDGVLQWAKVYNDGSPEDGPNDITIDKQGNIIITGGSATLNDSTSYSLTVKYNPAGDTLWVRKFTQLGTYSVNNKVVTDDSSNVYTTGYYTPDNLRSHFLTLKYNSSGNLMWYSTYYYDPAYQQDLAFCIAIDSNRNVYVAGISWTQASGNRDNSLLKINSSNGVIQWAKVYKGIGENNQCAIPMALLSTPDGDRIFYTTASGVAPNTADFVTLGYNSIGDSLWVRRNPMGGIGIPAYSYSTLKLDKFGDVYICGSSRFNNGSDFVTIKYNQAGIQQWIETYNGGGSDLFIDSGLNVYVTGGSLDSNNRPVAVIIKYSQLIGINNTFNELPFKYELCQNFPNPFNASTVINYNLPKFCSIRLLLYNVLGEELITIINTKQAAGRYSLSINMNPFSSGVYFYCLFVNDQWVDTKKMIFLK